MLNPHVTTRNPPTVTMTTSFGPGNATFLADVAAHERALDNVWQDLQVQLTRDSPIPADPGSSSTIPNLLSPVKHFGPTPAYTYHRSVPPAADRGGSHAVSSALSGAHVDSDPFAGIPSPPTHPTFSPENTVTSSDASSYSFLTDSDISYSGFPTTNHSTLAPSGFPAKQSSINATGPKATDLSSQGDTATLVSEMIKYLKTLQSHPPTVETVL